MTGPAWLIDSKRIASKIKNASGAVDSGKFKWISNPTKACPECSFIIDNSDVVQEWPGLPEGVKFDPSDPELLGHLLAKVGITGSKSHPFINEFIPTVEGDDGICYTHPQKLPGVKQDGSVSHFFHRTFKAYNTGTRKRRKINSDELVGGVRWHKTGKTKPVLIDGEHLGCKKIMVLYMSTSKGKKPEKTNWVMHQYHIGTGEDERDGEYVVSKIFYQQQAKPGDKSRQDLVEETFESAAAVPDSTPLEQIAPEYYDGLEDPNIFMQEPDQVDIHEGAADADINILPMNEMHDGADDEHKPTVAKQSMKVRQVDIHEGAADADINILPMNEMHDCADDDHKPTDDTKWWEGESQILLNSQQLAEGIAICNEFLLSQTSCDGESKNSKPSLLDYGAEDLKRDLEECQNVACTKNIELDSAPEFRLSQLEFGSQDSFLQGLEANFLND